MSTSNHPGNGEPQPLASLEESPVLLTSFSPFSACALLVTYTLIYVLPLYGSSKTRPSPTLSRDDPSVIRARMRSVRSSTTVCLISTFLILHYHGHDSAWTDLHKMGFWPIGCRETLSTLTLTGMLFAGPLYEALFIEGRWRDVSSPETLRQTWTSLITWRNLVVGPITEELLFRSAAVPLFLLAQLSASKIIFLTPVIFGLAHIHHFYEFRITNQGVSLTAAVVRSLLQFTYTTLFGAYATYLFIRTGSLLAAVAAHSFCNAMGLPRFWGLVEPHWLAHLPESPYRRECMKWTFVYYLLLALGAWAWWQGLMTLTISDSALVHMSVRT